MLFWGALILPIRGGVGVAPINAGTVYFSKNMFVNHVAINVVWNAGSSVFNHKPTTNPYRFGDPGKAGEIVDSLTAYDTPPLKLLNNTRPDIL